MRINLKSWYLSARQRRACSTRESWWVSGWLGLRFSQINWLIPRLWFLVLVTMLTFAMRGWFNAGNAQGSAMHSTYLSVFLCYNVCELGTEVRTAPNNDLLIIVWPRALYRDDGIGTGGMGVRRSVLIAIVVKWVIVSEHITWSLRYLAYHKCTASTEELYGFYKA